MAVGCIEVTMAILGISEYENAMSFDMPNVESVPRVVYHSDDVKFV